MTDFLWPAIVINQGYLLETRVVERIAEARDAAEHARLVFTAEQAEPKRVALVWALVGRVRTFIHRSGWLQNNRLDRTRGTVAKVAPAATGQTGRARTDTTPQPSNAPGMHRYHGALEAVSQSRRTRTRGDYRG